MSFSPGNSCTIDQLYRPLEDDFAIPLAASSTVSVQHKFIAIRYTRGQDVTDPFDFDIRQPDLLDRHTKRNAGIYFVYVLTAGPTAPRKLFSTYYRYALVEFGPIHNIRILALNGGTDTRCPTPKTYNFYDTIQQWHTLKT